MKEVRLAILKALIISLVIFMLKGKHFTLRAYLVQCDQEKKLFVPL